MGEWLIVLGIAVAVVAVFETLTFYGPFTNKFTKRRYRRALGADHVAPIFEVGVTVLLALLILFLARFAFPVEADEFLDDVLPSNWAIGVAAVLGVVVGLQVFVIAPREARQLLSARGAKFDELSPHIQEALKDLRKDLGGSGTKKADKLISRERLNGLMYWPVALINWLLPAALVWLFSVGLAHDVDEALAARRVMRADLPVDFNSFGALLHQLEVYYGAFRDYEVAMLDLAIDLTAVLAVVFAITFYVLGTLVYTIYTRNAQFFARVAASLVVFVLLPTLIFVSYLQFVSAHNEVTGAVAAVGAAVDEQALSYEDLVAYNDVIDRLRDRVDLGGFWAKVVTSGGGLVLLLGTIASIWQNRLSRRYKTSSYLQAVVPQRVVKAMLARREKESKTLGLVGKVLLPRHDGRTGPDGD